MKFVAAIPWLLATSTHAWTISKIEARQTKVVGCDAPVSLDTKTNIWLNYTLHPNIIYRKKVEAAAAAINDTELKKAALKVADTGTFVWIEGKEQISRIEEVVKDVPCNHVLGLVISGIPNKGCQPTIDPVLYTEEYINPIAKILKSYPNTAFALIVEPNLIGTVVLNPQGSCADLAKSYRQNVPHALKSLNLPNVVLYLDGAHGGWLGWKRPEDIQKLGAKELITTWENAGKPSQFRGLAINVASYNSWDMSPGEMFLGENTSYDLDNPARSEQKYLNIMTKRVRELKSTMPTYSLMDTSRNGWQGLREKWTDWCNVNQAAFGRVPSSATGDQLLDAFVWAKWGGVSDGTSDVGSSTYDSYCGKTDSFKPMPERGEWSQAYFEMLLTGWRSKDRGPLRRRGLEEPRAAQCG